MMLDALLQEYPVRNARDADMVARTQAFLAREPRAFDRDPATGHITGSAFCLSDCGGLVLLLHHAKLDRWLQPGGHCDGQRDVAAVAARELFEETGVNARQVSGAIHDIDIHLIPARGADPAHLHYDIRFLFRADATRPLIRNAESRALRWVPLAEVAALAGDSVAVMRDKLP